MDDCVPQTSNNVTDSSRSFEWRILIVSMVVMFVPLLIVVFPVIALLSDPFGGTDEPVAVSPSDGFFQLTGWRLPDDASILKNSNSHRGFKNDGDYVLIVRMLPSQLQNLFESDSHQWLECPVNSEIVRSAWAFPEHSGTRYYAQKTRDSDADWHRGHVVITNLETGMVWIYEWKI